MIVIDMDMPKSCEECSALHRPYSNIESTFCHLKPYEYIKVEDITKKADFCPIKCDIEDINSEIKEAILKQRYVATMDGLSIARGIINKHTTGDTDADKESAE